MVIINNYSLEERPWTERDDKILEAFFLTNKTYRQIGSELGITKTRVAQLIIAQIRRIMHPIGLQKYWDVNYDPNRNTVTTNAAKESKIKLEEKYGNQRNWLIKDMLFPVRVRNSLLRSNINIVEELLRRIDSLGNIKGLSKKGIEEIHMILKIYKIK